MISLKIFDLIQISTLLATLGQTFEGNNPSARSHIEASREPSSEREPQSSQSEGRESQILSR